MFGELNPYVVHELHLLDGPLGGPVHRRLSPYLRAKIPDLYHRQMRVSNGMGCLSFTDGELISTFSDELNKQKPYFWLDMRYLGTLLRSLVLR